MRAQYGGEPTATEWSHIIDEDERVCWDSSQPAVYDPESQDPVDPYKIECPPSQSDGSEPLFDDSILSSQETRLPEGGCHLLSSDWLNFPQFSLLDLSV